MTRTRKAGKGVFVIVTLCCPIPGLEGQPALVAPLHVKERIFELLGTLKKGKKKKPVAWLSWPFGVQYTQTLEALNPNTASDDRDSPLRRVSRNPSQKCNSYRTLARMIERTTTVCVCVCVWVCVCVVCMCLHVCRER